MFLARRSTARYACLLLLAVPVCIASGPASISAQVSLPPGTLPDPSLLPAATLSQAPLTAAYDALNVPAIPAGFSYFDPTSGAKIYKLTSSIFPTSGASFGHDYFEGNYEISLPYTADGVTRAVLVFGSDAYHYLIDFTPGLGVSNARRLTGSFLPNHDIAFTFSNKPATPYYAYVLNGSTLHRIDIRTMTEASGNGWPLTNVGSSGTWLQQSAHDGEFVWMDTPNGPTTFHYVPATGTLLTHTDTNINEPRIDRGGRYVAFSMNVPMNGLQMWDTQTNTITWASAGDPGIPFAHEAALQGLWVANNWNGTYPFPFATATPTPNSLQNIWGPSVGNLPIGNGSWMQYPASGDQRDAWTVWNSYGSLDGTGGWPGPWLAPGGMVLITVNGGLSTPRLLGHPYSHQSSYWEYAWPKFSADGNYVLFTSDMHGSGRYDLFLAELPTSSSFDATPPTVAITAPTSGSTVAGTISVVGSASDNVGVVGVQFRLDGANLGSQVTAAPYAISWNTTTTANGSHTLTAVAQDAAGNIANSAAVTVTVSNKDTSPPTVSITAPVSGAAVVGAITVSAAATDNVGVTGVQFKLDGANLGSQVTAAPYATSWNTTTAANGSHTLTAVARDAAGNVATSSPVVVTVANGVPGGGGGGGGGGSLMLQNVLWTTLVNATATGNSVQKTGGCDGCADAGATSQQRITAGDGYGEFTASETGALRYVGLTTGTPGTNAAAIKFAIGLQAGIATVWESGTYRADTPFATGDVFRIAIQSRVVRYYKNGRLFYTSAVSPTYPLLLDAALYNANATITNAVIYGLP